MQTTYNQPGLQGKYDAWNRLVEARNSSGVLLATYAYNGMNHRVKKTVGATVTTSYYNAGWQELESRTSEVATTFVWGKRYIDDLILRDKSTERLYSLADPNWNVVAITNAAGTVLERMKYDAFGKITWLDAAFGTKASSGYAWNRTFTGQVFDSETGLMLYRNRYLHTGFGRFTSRDPIGYDAEDNNLYRYVGNSPLIYLDQDGKWAHVAGSCLAGGVVSGFIAWLNGGKPGCAAFGGCLTGSITALFPSVAGGCIGGVVGGVASKLCSNGFCINSPCDVIGPIISGISGCLGGAAAGISDKQIEFIAGLMGVNTQLYGGILENLCGM
jgi:RHS repeat-associated protein